MSSPHIHVTLDTRKLDEIAAKSGKSAKQVVKRFTYKFKAGAQMRAPFKTGFLRSSIDVDFSQLDSDGIGIVEVGAEYGIHQELGTSRMKAQPFMKPTADEIAEQLNGAAEWEELWN